MEKIEEQLNNLSSMEIPTGMHQSIMQKVNYRRIRPILFTAFFLFLFNFILIAWRINVKLVNAEFSTMMNDFFDGFVWSSSFVNTILGSFFEIISPTIFVSLLINLVGAIYLGNKIRISEYGKKLHFETI